MLITFSSKAYENIVMFEDVAKKLLHLMGNTGTVPGALLPDELSGALSQLEAGLMQVPKSKPQSSQQDDEYDDEVSLAHRAIPLINMLKSAMKHRCTIMWK